MAELLGVVLALLGALGIAAGSILIRMGTTDGRSGDAIAIVLLTNVVVAVPAAAIVSGRSLGLTPSSIVAFIAAGLTGTLLGRAFYYTGIARIGPARADPIKASMPVFAAIVAIAVLGETLTAGHLVGIFLVVAGVGLVSWEVSRGPNPAGDDLTLVGLAFPLAAAICYGVEPTFAKIGFAAGTPFLVGLALKSVVAAIGFLGYRWWRAGETPWSWLDHPGTGWFVAAGVVNSIFQLAYYAALAVAPVVIVTPIIQASPLFVVALSFVFIQRLERVTWRIATAATVVVAGAVAITIYG